MQLPFFLVKCAVRRFVALRKYLVTKSDLCFQGLPTRNILGNISYGNTYRNDDISENLAKQH